MSEEKQQQEQQQDQVMTIADKIRELVVIENGQSSSTMSETEKKDSISKGNIFETIYQQVSENVGYDASGEAINELLSKFKEASDQPGKDPVFQNGFAERIIVDGTSYDVGLIKCSNAVCNNTTVGTYQTFRFQFRLNQTNPDEIDTVENEWDLDLSGKVIDLNRPNKTALKDGLITSYLNKGNLSISVTVPVSGNDQDYFNQHFQEDLARLISYGLSSTLSEMVKEGVIPTDLAEAEIKLTSRSSVEEMIRKAAKSRYSEKTEEEIDEIVDSVYPALTDKLDIKPLTSKSITIGVYATLVEKAQKNECKWESTNSKWNFYSAGDYVMRYRPIANSVQTFPVTDNVYESLSNSGKEFFGAFVNFSNYMLCSELGLENINPVICDTNIPEHTTKLSETIGINPKDLYSIRKEVKNAFLSTIYELLEVRDRNTKTDTMKKFHN